MLATERDRPKVTVAIPLFMSKRYLDDIIANIDAASQNDVEFLISDRHCFDDSIDILANHYAGNSRIRYFKASDKLDWVGNINFLIREAKGKYFRVTPHDDIFPMGGLEMLIQALENNPDAILAYGPSEVIDNNKNTIKKFDRPHPEQAENGWSLGVILEMYWNWYFIHAFKGLLHRDSIVSRGIFIRETLGNILPERCWLFGLALIGRFIFVPRAKYIKRRYSSSVSSGWSIKGCHILSNARTMSSYINDLIPISTVSTYGTRDIWLNACRRARWLDTKTGPVPSYKPAPGLHQMQFRKLQLPL